MGVFIFLSFFIEIEMKHTVSKVPAILRVHAQQKSLMTPTTFSRRNFTNPPALDENTSDLSSRQTMENLSQRNAPISPIVPKTTSYNRALNEPSQLGIKMKNEDGNAFWALSGTRRLTVNTFNNKVYVDIRDFYKPENNHALPMRRGLALTLEQFETIISIKQSVVAEVKNAMDNIKNNPQSSNEKESLQLKT